MTARQPIPSFLRNRILTESVLADVGLTRHRFSARDMHKVRPGMYTTCPEAVSTVDIALDIARRTPDAVVYGVTAGQFHRMRLPSALQRTTWLHLARTHGKDRIRRARVRGVTATFLPGEVQEIDGALITTPERTFFDLAKVLTPRALVAVGDGLVCCHRFGIHAGIDPQSTIARISAVVADHAGERGVARARRALSRVRVGADSVMETEMRLIAEDYGIEGWDLDVAIDVDGKLVQPDLRHRDSGLFVQYEGFHHNSPQQVQRDIERLRRTEQAGYRELRVYSKDLRTAGPDGRDITPRLIPLLTHAISEAHRARAGTFER